MMIDERALIPISELNALKKVRCACVVKDDHSLFEDVFEDDGQQQLCMKQSVLSFDLLMVCCETCDAGTGLLEAYMCAHPQNQVQMNYN